jgi:ABC-type amino acid transport substrate-binding protein
MRRMRFAGMVAAAVAVAGMTGASAGAEESVLVKVKRDGVLRVCFAQGTPDNYKDPKSGEWVGVFVDLVNELATWMKVKVEKVEVQWDVAVLTLKRGDCDLFGASLIYNAPRAMEINYIRPFWAKGMNAIIPKANPKKLRKPEDLNNDKVTLAVIVGSREHETAKRLFPSAKILALKVNADVQIAESVKRGDADAALLPTITVRWWLAVPENAAWGAMGFPGSDFGNAPNGWAIRYGDPDWKDFLDAFSGWVAANNVAVGLYDEYLKKSNPFAR